MTTARLDTASDVEQLTTRVAALTSDKRDRLWELVGELEWNEPGVTESSDDDLDFAEALANRNALA